MMPSPPIRHRTDTCHSGRLSPGSTPARAGPQNWPVIAPQILVEQPAIRSFTPARTPKLRAKTTASTASDQLHQHSRRRQIPIAPAAPSVPHTPRFRALALFGRRPSERVDGLGIPASENLHRTCLPRCKKDRETFSSKARHAAPTRIGCPQCSLRGDGCDDGSSSRGLEARLRGRLRRARSNWQCP